MKNETLALARGAAKRSPVFSRNGMVTASQPLAAQVGLDILKKGGNAVDAAIATNACLGLMEPTACGIGGDLFAIVYDPKNISGMNKNSGSSSSSSSSSFLDKFHGLNSCGACPLDLTLDMVHQEKQRLDQRSRQQQRHESSSSSSGEVKKSYSPVASGEGGVPRYSPVAWTVPGCVDGWVALRQRFGSKTLKMKDVLAPAILYAREGFPVSPVVALEWNRGAQSFAGVCEGFSEVFMPPPTIPAGSGQFSQPPSIFKNMALASTLERIAQAADDDDAGGGDNVVSAPRDGFYSGFVRDEIINFSQANGGAFSAKDFEKVNAEWVEPVATTYRDSTTLLELPFPGQGIAACEMLNILENFDLKNMTRSSPLFWHHLIEAKKLAFIDRAKFFCDPTFCSSTMSTTDAGAKQQKEEETVEAIMKRLCSKEYAKQLAAKISPDRAHQTEPDLPADPICLAQKETTYLCAADRESGLMVSLIQSNYTGFGSGYCVPSLGFGLQNRGSCFTVEPGKRNTLVGGKRPFHTIIPAAIVETVRDEQKNNDENDSKNSDGNNASSSPPFLRVTAMGVMGGDQQPQGHAQIIVNLTDFGMNLQECGDVARFHHFRQSDPAGESGMVGGGIVHLEDDAVAVISSSSSSSVNNNNDKNRDEEEAKLRQELQRMGHKIEGTVQSTFGGYQAISFDERGGGVFCGATESRKDGQAVGF